MIWSHDHSASFWQQIAGSDWTKSHVTSISAVIGSELSVHGRLVPVSILVCPVDKKLNAFNQPSLCKKMGQNISSSPITQYKYIFENNFFYY